MKQKFSKKTPLKLLTGSVQDADCGTMRLDGVSGEYVSVNDGHDVASGERIAVNDESEQANNAEAF